MSQIIQIHTTYPKYRNTSRIDASNFGNTCINEFLVFIMNVENNWSKCIDRFDNIVYIASSTFNFVNQEELRLIQVKKLNARWIINLDLKKQGNVACVTNSTNEFFHCCNGKIIINEENINFGN